MEFSISSPDSSCRLTEVFTSSNRHVHIIPRSLSAYTLFLFLSSLCFLPSCTNTAAQIDLIDGNKAMHHVEQIVGFGPHPSGSNAQKKVGAYIVSQLESYGLEVNTQNFRPVTPIGRREMKNIWATSTGTTESVIILASHYDSKYFEEFPFVGANDSGSSTALVLELARILTIENTTDHTLWFVFFDGEEAFLDWTTTDSLYGSRAFLGMLKASGRLHRIDALLLLDMIGGKDLAFRKDTNSTTWLNTIIWDTASQMGYDNIFQMRGSTTVQDDHIPFAKEQIPVVDIIDLDYIHWHRQGDTIDKLSVNSFEIVGNVVLASLPTISQYLLEKH